MSLRTWKGFPGGAVVESLSANAGDTGSSPGLGRSHMSRSNWAREPQLLSLRVWSLCSATREAAIVRGPRTAVRGGPRLPQLEKALAQKRKPNIAIKQSINQSIFKKKKKRTWKNDFKCKFNVPKGNTHTHTHTHTYTHTYTHTQHTWQTGPF